MKALSIRQPWASLIVWGLKDIENRAWPTEYRGPFWVHAGWNLNTEFAADLRDFFDRLSARVGLDLRHYADIAFPRGGIIGRATLADCITESLSPWFIGTGYGFVITNPQERDFQPLKGQSGFCR